MQTDVIIIGGGIAGLACGVELSRSGLTVTLLESDAELGGRARSWTDPETGDRVDIGPHILLSEYKNMRHLLDDLGTSNQVVWRTDKLITLVDKPHPIDIQMHPFPAPLPFMPSLLKAPQVSLWDLASCTRVMWQIVRLTDKERARLDAVAAEDHLRAMGVSEHFIQWFWSSACISIMNVPLHKCSAGALLRFFRFMIGNNGFQVGFAGNGLGDLFAPTATARIEAAGGQVLTRTPVMKITESGGSVTGVQLADGTPLEAQTCVAAVPPQQLLELLPQSWVHRKPIFQNLKKFEPVPYISSYLWFDRKLTKECFWARVWAPENFNYDSYDLSNIRPGWSGRPSLIASNIIYSHKANGMTDDDIVATTLAELREFLPDIVHAKLLHSRVHRIPMAVPAPVPGAERLRPPVTTPIAGLLITGDWVDTGLPASMESAVRAGYMAAEYILAQRGHYKKIAMATPETEGLVRVIGGR